MAETGRAEGALHAGEFAALMARLGPFERQPRLGLAVSGGADSMALALLAAGWAMRQGGSVQAFTVDHGLRPEAAAEAAQVADWLGARGIPVTILRWTGPRPAGGIQRRAREARLALLSAACREEGILHLLMAHHRDDLAETVAMRAARSSGAAGLAGIPAIREIEGLRLLRPLLGVPRSRLAASLEAVGQGWIEDPSNADERFERARLRGDSSFDTDGWITLAERMAAERCRAETADAAFLASHAGPHPLGFVRCPREPFAALEPAARVRVLARILICVGGRSLPPRGLQVERLATWLAEPVASESRTAAGCRVSVAAGRFTVCREAGRIAGRVALEPGGCVLWDGRFRLRAGATQRRIEIGAAGAAGRALLPRAERTALQRAGIPAAALEALPAVWEDGRPGRPLGVAAEARGDASSCQGAVRLCFAPCIPLAGASFARANVV